MSDSPAVRDGIHEIVARAAHDLKLRRAWLFGSRARGDARRDSDVDLAFEHDSPPAAWADFVNTMREEASLLLDLDLVDMREASPEMRQRILREGKLLHG